MRIFMTGGTRFLGSSLTKALTNKGHRVKVLTRGLKRGHPPLKPYHTCSRSKTIKIRLCPNVTR